MAENKEYFSKEVENGSIQISEEVVSSVAAMAVLEVEGVCGLASNLGYDIAEMLGKAYDAVLALPDKYRETVVLFYYKQMKIREIAEALHIPQNSVSSRLRRARAMLQIDMEGGKDA